MRMKRRLKQNRMHKKYVVTRDHYWVSQLCDKVLNIMKISVNFNLYNRDSFHLADRLCYDIATLEFESAGELYATDFIDRTGVKLYILHNYHVNFYHPLFGSNI